MLLVIRDFPMTTFYGFLTTLKHVLFIGFTSRG